MTATSAPDRCPRCGAAHSVGSPDRCTQCGYRYRRVSTAVARRDRLARWDPWLGLGVPISVGAILAAVGVNGGDMILGWIGVALAVIGAPIGWLIGRRSQDRRA
ncbi:MAG: hypothetical protein ABI534_07815 [Chloroflexota bacterium]